MTDGFFGPHTEREGKVAISLLPVVIWPHCVHPQDNFLIVLKYGLKLLHFPDFFFLHLVLVFMFITQHKAEKENPAEIFLDFQPWTHPHKMSSLLSQISTKAIVSPKYHISLKIKQLAICWT